MALSCALHLFLLQDYCVLGSETVQFNRHKRLEGICCLPSVPYFVVGSTMFLRILIFTAWNAVRRLAVFHVFSLSRCRGTKISKEEVLICFRFLEKHRFINVSLRVLLRIF